MTALGGLYPFGFFNETLCHLLEQNRTVLSSDQALSFNNPFVLSVICGYRSVEELELLAVSCELMLQLGVMLSPQ
jgi:hypothetical protein